MPNRIIKESTFTSDRIAALSDFEFRLWVGLSFAARSAKGDVIVIDSPVYRGFFGGMSLGPC